MGVSEEGQAYAEALRLCREAEASGAAELAFDFELAGWLTRLPPELGRLASLQSLDLSGCQWISDLRPLAGLASLQSLDLSRCEQISDLQPLAGLASLHSLNLYECRQVSDLQPLAGLASLQSLNLSYCWQVGDLQPLAGLALLQSLDLSWCEQVSDLQPLAGLTSLQSLNLNGCDEIRDLQPLAGLASLQSLELSRCEQISDLQPLAGLASLHSLNLYECRQVSDLQPLAGLTSLQSLNLNGCDQIRDLQPLAGLASLQSLYLSGTQISDLHVLAGLALLQSLDLSWCGQIRDLQPLAGLALLQSLDLSGCAQIGDLQPLAGLASLWSLKLMDCRDGAVFAPLGPLFAGLKELYLYGTQFADIPTEICGDSEFENVIAKVRAHFEDRRAGSVQDAEVRVLVLGNGGVGKTQLCRRLQGLEFDTAVPSTHGIQLGEMPLDLEDCGTPIRLNLWDFGGQEIYHGSHALFLHGHAVFLILWSPALEDAAPYEENGIPLRHRPLAYWLDYVREFAGTGNSVVVVQSQCDRPAQRVRDLPGGASLGDFSFWRHEQASAKTGLGLDSVKAAVKEAVRDLLARRPLPPIGTVRVRVRQRLREMLKADGERKRWLERAEFDRLCEEEGGSSDAEALLDFLHHQGVVFYRRGLFGGRIVVDQNWALTAIYTLFDRRKCVPFLRKNNGRFTRSDLELLAWRGFQPEEQEVFLGMMQSCGICFRLKEDEYLAPELLPGWSEAKDGLLAGRLLAAAPDAEASARFGFLHEGVLRSYLSKVGERAGDAAVYWKYGCWFYEKTTDSRVLVESAWEDTVAESGPGVVRFRAWGARARDLIEPLVGELERVSMGQRPVVEWADGRAEQSLDGAEMATLQITEAVHPPVGKRAIYISYAWGGGATDAGRQRAAVADGLCRACEEEGWQVFRDRTSTSYGDLISEFMKAMTRADLILVVLSQKYLQSRYCVAELHGIYQRSQGYKDEFLGRVVPFTLKDAKIGEPNDRVAHGNYWGSVSKTLEPIRPSMAVDDFRLYKAAKTWEIELADILAFIDDKLHPHGFDAIVTDNYAGLRTMLRKKAIADSGV